MRHEGNCRAISLTNGWTTRLIMKQLVRPSAVGIDKLLESGYYENGVDAWQAPDQTREVTLSLKDQALDPRLHLTQKFRFVRHRAPSRISVMDRARKLSSNRAASS